jgi:BirA family biotin operon repressor/biotin-[acetyl-CoA-carboxylase] ligase
VVAEEQTAGRGRQGRSWAAPRGRALTLSALWRLDGSFELLPLAVALAVCEACESITPVRCRIKWPNDVWIGERKLAGILIETRPRERWALIGIGLNVETSESEFAPELTGTATSLRIESEQPVDRNGVLAALLDALEARLGMPGEGADSVLAAYRERDLLRGRRISWTTGATMDSGEAQGIDESGNLVVFTDGGDRVTLGAGEVHLLPGEE